MKKIESKVNNEEYKKIKQYCEKRDVSIFKLVKDSVLNTINGKTLDDFN